ncbi:unnamed protein product [Rotaria sp. Silwood2]|nr:unnamed protein product [Rotaria sp. Silwood2]CAF2947794.1 unnamed protein product [Rotaria sp. Silwood2]CAF3268029.1 unnamed protein product [Rotaria sp. Silwood2]CAF3334389.1 unnamed protein product [Rotaria sp. Silwood2]
MHDDDEAALDIRTDSLHGQVQEVVGVMKDNIDKLLDRDVALNNLVTRTDDLQSSATTYNRTAKQLKRKYWWKNTKTNICIGGIVITVVLIIISELFFVSLLKNFNGTTRIYRISAAT